MARIHGLELKNIKYFEGMEGRMCQGNMYLNGKKIGFWSQDSWGGQDNYDFDVKKISERKFNELVEKTCAPFKYRGSEISTNLDILMEDIVLLNQIEKDWRKFVKNGTPLMILADFPDLGEYIEYGYSDKKSTSQALMAAQKENESNPRYCDQEVDYYLFVDEESFRIGDPFELEEIEEVA